MKHSVTHARGAAAWLRHGGRIAGVVVALVLVVPTVAAQEAGTPSSVRTEQVGPASHVFVDGADANAGFIVTASSVVVIGAPDSAAAAARWLEAIRVVSPKPVSHVLLTGYHAGQAAGLAALKAQGAAIVARQVTAPPAAALPATPAAEAAPVTAAEPPVAPAAEAPAAPASAPEPDPPADAVELAQPAAALAAAATALDADLWLDDSTDLLFGGVHIQAVVLAPVHGPHEMAYLLPDDGVVYAGELLVTGRLPDVRDADAARWVEALAALQKLGAKVAVPSRGAASRDPQAELQRLRDYLESVFGVMGEAARSRTPFDEAYSRGDWSRWAALPMFESVHRANARHAYLQAQAPVD